MERGRALDCYPDQHAYYGFYQTNIKKKKANRSSSQVPRNALAGGVGRVFWKKVGVSEYQGTWQQNNWGITMERKQR